MRQFFGKYRGRVVDNADPMMLGRLMVSVPSTMGDAVVNWAMPCVPFAGPGVGFCMTPPIGAAVWVEFEGGDPDYPIWTGCFWGEGERPAEAGSTMVRMIRTDCGQLRLDDTPGDGGFTLSVGDPAVDAPITIQATSAGLAITVGDTIVRVDDGSISLSAPPGRVLMTSEGVSIVHGSAEIAAFDPAVTITSDPDLYPPAAPA